MRWTNYTTRQINQKYLFIVTLVLVTLALIVDFYKMPQFEAAEKQGALAAANMIKATAMISEYRRINAGFDLNTDPNKTGLIGVDLTDITTTQGAIIAKRTATNPAFAALIVHLLIKAGVKSGDNVAIAFSSSFPALNIAVLSAIKELNLVPVIISSLGASSYGANNPDFTWLDMESLLFRGQLWSYRSNMASLGGIIETQGGMGGEGIAMGLAALKRNHIALLDEQGIAGKLEPEIEARMDYYFSQKKKYAAFINVGGGIISLGWTPESAKLGFGLLHSLPKTTNPERGIIFRMFERGVPVIHLLNIERLASTYGLPIDPIPLPIYQNTLFNKKYFLNVFLNKIGVIFLIFFICLLKKRKVHVVVK